MTTSSDDGSGKSAPSNVIDIASKLPLSAFGESYTGKIAARVMRALGEMPALPHEHIAALMLVSHALQNYLRHGHNTSEEDLTHIMERAIEITDNTRIVIRVEEKLSEPGKR